MATTANAPPSSWLTVRRLRVHGLVLALCMWSVYAWDMASPGLHDRNNLLKGTDFLHFYTIGTLAREHRGDLLYDIRAQALMAPELVPGAERIVYLPLYGPQVSLLFMPLARLKYGFALMAWLALTFLIYAACCYAVWRRCPRLRSDLITVAILAFGYPGFFHLIAWGQNSAIALLCFSFAFLALNSHRPWIAGTALGLLVYKPSLLLGPALIFLLARDWPILLSAAASAIAELSIGWLYFGTAVFRNYVAQMLRLGRLIPLLEPRPYQMYSLRGFWTLLVPWPHLSSLLFGMTMLIAVVVAARIWKTACPLALRYAALLFASVLVSPHLTVYDLTILAPAFLLLADWMAGNCSDLRNRHLGTLLYLVFVLPLAGRLAAWTHVQLSVIAMSAVLGWLAFSSSIRMNQVVPHLDLATATES
jgi:hypothetical protein